MFAVIHLEKNFPGDFPSVNFARPHMKYFQRVYISPPTITLVTDTARALLNSLLLLLTSVRSHLTLLMFCLNVIAQRFVMVADVGRLRNNFDDFSDDHEKFSKQAQ